LDEIREQMGRTSDEEQMKELFKQYGGAIVDDMPFTVLFFRKGSVISGSKIKSEVVPTIGRLYSGVGTWSVK
jgi:ABC-type transport system substrate-binding protein